MVIKPEDRPKIIALTVLIGLFLLYFFISVLPKITSGNQVQQSTQDAGTSAPAPDPSAAAPAAILTATPGSSGSSTSPGAPAAVDLYAEIDQPPPATSDPFSPPLPTAEMLDVAQAPGTGNAGRLLNPTVGPAVLAGPALPGLGSQAGSAPPAIAPPPKPIITVQGVVTGSDPIAVLKIDNSTLYEREGAHLEGGVVVARIRDEGVQFQDGSRSFVLAIGHSSVPNQPSGKLPPPTGTTPVPLGPKRGISSLAAQSDKRDASDDSADAPERATTPATQIASVAFQADDAMVSPDGSRDRGGSSRLHKSPMRHAQ